MEINAQCSRLVFPWFVGGFRAAVGVRFQIPSQKPKKDFVEKFSGGVLLGKTNGKTWNSSVFLRLYQGCSQFLAWVIIVWNCLQFSLAHRNSSRCTKVCTWRNSQQQQQQQRQDTATWFSDSLFQHFISSWHYLESQHFWKSLSSHVTRLVILRLPCFRTSHVKEPSDSQQVGKRPKGGHRIAKDDLQVAWNLSF